jgi:hypothetical protein
MNCYSQCSAEESLTTTPDEADELARLLSPPEEPPDDQEAPWHGFELERHPATTGTVEAYIFAPDNFDAASLPDAFIKLIGKILTRLGKPSLEFGCSYSADRVAPGSCGGQNFRILARGYLEFQETYWPSEYNKPKKRKTRKA